MPSHALYLTLSSLWTTTKFHQPPKLRVLDPTIATELLERFRAGDQSAGSQLTRALKPLIHDIIETVFPHYHAGFEPADALAAAHLGLATAMARYDPQHESRATFVTFAYRHIQGAIRAAERDASPMDRVHYRRAVDLDEAYWVAYTEDRGKCDPNRAVAILHQIDPTAYAQVRTGADYYAQQVEYPYVKLVPFDDSLADTIPSPDLGPDEIVLRLELDAAISELPPRLERVIRMVLDGMTYAEIGAVLGCSPQRVGALVAKARRRLQVMMLGGEAA